MSVADGVAIGIAVLALAFSIGQGIATRRHNRLSLRPHLFFDTIMIEGQEGGLRLTNGGIGPAIADTFHVWLDNKDPGSQYDPADRGWSKIMDILKLPFGFNAFFLEANQIVQPGETLFVFSIIEGNRNPANDIALNQAVNRLAIEITYKSMYGEQFDVKWPFGKTLGLANV